MEKIKIKDVLHLFSEAEKRFINDYGWDEDEREIELGKKVFLKNEWSSMTVIVNEDKTEAEIRGATREASGYFTILFDDDDYFPDEFNER